MKHRIAVLLATFLLAFVAASPLAAKSSSHSSSPRRSSTTAKKTPPSTSAKKSVHVKSYTKKDGTVVKGYDRRPPNSK